MGNRQPPEIDLARFAEGVQRAAAIVEGIKRIADFGVTACAVAFCVAESGLGTIPVCNELRPDDPPAQPKRPLLVFEYLIIRVVALTVSLAISGI